MDLFLKNKVAIITGGNQGFGLEVAKEYLKAGASIALCARNEQLLSKVSEDLRLITSPDQRVLAITADVSKENDVRNFVDKAINEFGHIDILVNNAGVYGPKGSIEEVDWLSWVHAIEINLFGSILMCRAVLPIFKKRGHGKIIQLSGAPLPMPKISAYAVSKFAVVRFIETLAEEVREFNIDVNAIAPGALNTRMLEEVLEAGPEKVTKYFYDKSLKQKDSGGAGFNRGTALAVFLASNLSNGITGKSISAVWDNWENWPNYIKELQISDVYTLRRIVGRDRNLNWGDK